MTSENLGLVENFQRALLANQMTEASQLLAEDLKVERFFPHKSNKKAFMRAMQGLLSSMSEVTYNIIQVQTSQNTVLMKFQVVGNHSEPLDFSFMKLPIMPPTQRLIKWPVMQWEFLIANGRITQIRNAASLNKGMLGVLKAFGVKPPVRYQVDNLRKLLGLASSNRKGAQKKRKSPLRFMPLIPLTVITIMVLFVRSPINSAAWTPDAIPAWTGSLTPNNELAKADFLGQDQLLHPEDLAFDQQGRIYTGSDDGNIYRITLDDAGDVEAFQTWATVGGYPLGLAFDQSGNLITAVKDVGLLSIDPIGNIELLTNNVENTPITFANALAITTEGIVYFSDSSNKYDRGWPYDVLEARPNGRLLAYNLHTKETVIVKENLYFPNGIVLASDESYLLVNETTRYRIARYWLSGEKQGTWDYFAENLPILPDNISLDEYGNYLLGGGKRLALIDRIQSNASLKSQIAKLPNRLLWNIPKLPQNRYGLILILDANGNIKQSLHDPEGNIFAISSARSYDGFIYIGTLMGQDIARYPYQLQ